MNPTLKVVIIGGGFAGLSCFMKLDRSRCSVRLITQRNHFLFTPLLPLAATGVVEVRSIIEPLRSFQKKPDEVQVAEIIQIDVAGNRVVARNENGSISWSPYDFLVLAHGATTADYGIPGVKEHSVFLKEMKDARLLREKILFQFDKASQMQDEAQVRTALNFLIVGGGPTGVETAFEIEDLISKDLRREFPQLWEKASVQIFEAGKEILTVFDKTLVQYAQKRLQQKKILLHLNTAVKKVEKGRIALASGETIEGETVLWAVGNTAHPLTHSFAQQNNFTLGPQGRLMTDSHLKVQGAPFLYAIGDCAVTLDKNGRPLPATAQVAMKQGYYVADLLSGRNQKNKAFHFHSMGMLASLGSGSAIADLGDIHFKGLFAWWFWRAAYLTRLVSFRNKVSVAMDWIKVRLFGRNTSRVEF